MTSIFGEKWPTWSAKYYPKQIKRLHKKRIIAALSPKGVAKNSIKSKITKKYFKIVNELCMGSPPKI